MEATMTRRVPPAKTEPDAKDYDIVRMMGQGWSRRQIAELWKDAKQSIDGRIRWLVAERWMLGGRMLTPDQRDRLLQREQEFLKIEGISSRL